MGANTITIQVLVDTSQLQAGMATAASTVAAAMSGIKSQYAQAGSAMQASFQPVITALNGVMSGLKAVSTDIRALATSTDLNTQATIQNARSINAQTTALLTLTPALQSATSATNAQSNAQRIAQGNYTAARAAVAELQGSTMGLGFALGRAASESSVLGPILKAAFPAILAFGFLEILKSVVDKVIEFVHNLQDAVIVARSAGAAMVNSFRTSNDELVVSNALLDIQIAKLRGGVGNTLALELGEIALAADKLAGALDGDIQKMQQFAKENEVGWGKAAITGRQSTDYISEELKSFRYDISQIQTAGQIAIDIYSAAKDKTREQGAQTDLNTKLQERYNKELDLFTKGITAAENAEFNLRRQTQSAGVSGFGSQSGVRERGQILPTDLPAEHGRFPSSFSGGQDINISDLQAGAAALELERKRIGLQTTNEQKKGGEEAARIARDSAKNALEALKEANEDALNQMRLDHSISLEELRDYWAKCIATDKLKIKDTVDGRRYLLQMMKEESEAEDKIRKERIKSATEDIQAGAQTARAQGGAHGELSYLEGMSQALTRLPNMVDEYKRILREIPTVAEEAQRQTDAATKKAIENGPRLLAAEEHNDFAVIIKIWEEAASAKTASSAIQEEAARRIEAASKRLSEQERKLSEDAAQVAPQSNISQLEEQRAAIQRAEELGYNDSIERKISFAKKLAEIDRDILQEKINSLKAQAAIDADYGDSTAAVSKMRQAEALMEQLRLKALQDQTNVLNLEKHQYDQFFNQIQSGFTKALTGMITGQKNWQHQLQNIENQMLSDFIGMITKRVIHWIAGTLLMASAEKLFHTILQALHLEGKVQEKAIDDSSNVAQVTGQAAVAAATAYAANAYDPAIAEAAAAEAEIAVMSFAPQAAAAETGGIVPSNQMLVTPHAGEFITPAPLTKLLMNAATGNNTSTNNKSSSVQNNMNVGGVHLHGSGGRNSGQDVVAALKSHARRNNMKLR